MSEVILAKSAGFCFGVKRAVDTVYEQTNNNNVVTLGPIIHNQSVVKDFEDKGVRVIDSPDEVVDNSDTTVIIRSHGVAKSIYDSLESKNVKIIDATCPFVLKIHKIVKEESEKNSQIVIIGNEHHPEVEGIKGWCLTQDVYVVDSVEKAKDLELDPERNVCVVSQTTFNYNKFKELVEIISEKGYNVSIRNTICNATEERQTEARKIARMADTMIVIGDSSSSNTRKLYEICKNECENTIHIQTLPDLDLDKIGSSDCIGITAGASTPNNIIEEVYTNVRRKFCTDVR
ncbi:MAG: 4-hydroxy-3-methylbut-2-enyl diphosphate reductase [Lachnospira sp.]